MKGGISSLHYMFEAYSLSPLADISGSNVRYQGKQQSIVAGAMVEGTQLVNHLLVHSNQLKIQQLPGMSIECFGK